MYPGSQTRLTEEVIASTTSITVLSDMIRVTGTTSIATITPPLGGYNSILVIIPVDGNVATLTTGNISLAVTMPVSRATLLAYNKATGKWYPGAIS